MIGLRPFHEHNLRDSSGSLYASSTTRFNRLKVDCRHEPKVQRKRFSVRQIYFGHMAAIHIGRFNGVLLVEIYHLSKERSYETELSLFL